MKKIILSKVKSLIEEHKTVSEQHQKDLAYYGDSYRNSIRYDIVELQLAIIDLKFTILKSFVKI